ncbi:MAG TPA: biotin/lipoyl-binding protein, partial [Acidobacteriota bacterium]|nr:biotin/lipoyl-binding protein [Acidobacteriota bacterium]
MPTPDKKRRRRFIILSAAVLVVAVLLVLRARHKTEADHYVLQPIDLTYTILANCTVDYPRPLDLTFQTAGVVLAVEVADGQRVSHGQALVRLDDFEARRNLAIRADGLRSAELKLKNVQDEVLPSLAEKLRESEAVRAQAERTLKRSREIEAAGGISKAELEKADREYQTALSRFNQQRLELENYSRSGRLADLAYQASIARAQLELAQRDLENTRLTAPFEGTVV